MKYVATQSTIRTVDGVDYNVSANVTRVDENHPLYRSHPDLFKRVEGDEPEVEQATQGPGERRGSTRKP